jgi:hypothetical protein
VHVCIDLACQIAGAEVPEGAHESPCLGLCERAAAVFVTDAGVAAAARRCVAPATPDRRSPALVAARACPTSRHPTSRCPRSRAAASELVLLRGRHGRPVEPPRLPRPRWLPGTASGDRARPDGGHPRDARVEDPGPRRRRLPGRPQVGGRRAPRRAPAPPGLQRRRERARHLQGPRPHRGRPVRLDRGDDDRRVRDRLRARLPLPARRVPAGRGAPCATRSSRRTSTGCSATT